MTITPLSPDPRGPEQRRPSGILLVLLLGSLSAFGALTIDMYVPALPSMAAQLRSSEASVQATLTIFVVGLALGQVVVGPLSDALGRRWPLLVGLGIYVAGSLACAFAPTVAWLIVGRLVQSFGAAAGTVLARAVARDLYSGTAMTRFLSVLMLVNGLAPVLAPVAGAQILTWATWRVVFWVLTAMGVILLVITAIALPESLPDERRRSTRPMEVFKAFRVLCGDAGYRRHVLAAALMFSAVFIYISESSFVLQDVYGLSALAYGLIFGLNGLGIIAAGLVNGALVGRVASESTLLIAALGLAAVGACIVSVSAAIEAPLPVLLTGLFIAVSMLGPVLADATSLALADHADAAGTASSLQGMAQFLLAALAAAVTTQISNGPAAMGGAMTVCVLLALSPLVIAVRRH